MNNANILQESGMIFPEHNKVFAESCQVVFFRNLSIRLCIILRNNTSFLRPVHTSPTIRIMMRNNARYIRPH